MPSVQLEGRSLHFEDMGEGTPVLLLHGFPFTSESLWPQLERPPRGARLIVPDHRGFGRSAPGAGALTMDAIASDALHLLDALGVESAVVGGVSMGGYASMAVARLAPERVRALVLIDTQHGADDEAGRARREATAVEVQEKGAAAVADAMLPRLLTSEAATEVRERIGSIMRSQAPAAIAAASRGMAAREDSGEVLARFGGPSLIIVGAQDVHHPSRRAQAMAALMRDVVLEILDGAGHLANLERPEPFALALERFLEKVR